MKKITFLFALLCASVMGWATVYNDTELSLDAGETAGQTLTLTICKSGEKTTQVVAKSTTSIFTGVYECIWQQYGGGTAPVIGEYTVTDHEISFTTTWETYPTSATQLRFVARRNNTGGGSDIFGGTATSAEVTGICGSTPGSDPDPTPDPAASIDWNEISFLGTSNFKIYFTEANRPANYESVHIETAPWAAGNTGIYVTFPDGVSNCSLGDKEGCWIEGAQVLMYLSAFTKQVTEVTITHASGTKTLYIYNADGEPEDLTGWNIAKGKTSTAGFNAEAGHAGANDGNFNSRWSSNGGIHYPAAGAQDWWYVDLGDFYRVDQIKILFEGAAPTDYDLLISNNAVSWAVIGTYSGTPKIGNNPATDYNEYNFTDKIGRYVKIFARAAVQGDFAYGISMWEFEVYGDHASIDDHNPPTMTSASLSGDPSYDQVNIAVAGTDPEDGVVTQFHVVDATHGVDQSQTAEAGVITVTGLNAETSYTFTITALDAAGNESANSVNVAATTAQDTSIPLVTAPVPSGTGKEILPIYCDAFASILEHSFDKDGFAGVTLMMEQNISGDHSLVYNVAGANEVTWGMYDDGANAIIAQSEYRGSGMGVDASAMEYLHIDIWSQQAGTNVININVDDAALTSLRLSHDGTGWNSYDIALSDFGFNPENPAYSSDNVRWMKFNGIGFISGKMALDNVYFWKTATGLHAVSATANNASYGTASVVVTETGLAPEGGMVTDGTEVTFSATPNDGYIFVDWSNGNTNATFNATVDATMNLTANFRALNHICCNEEMTNGDYTAYVTYKKTANDNEYVLIVRSAKEMVNFTNAYVGHINGDGQINMNGQGVLSGNGHMLSYTFTSTTEPKLNTPLYVNFAGHGEVTFDQINNSTVFEFSQPCADPEITAIELNRTEATLDMGNTLTLVPSFTPAYMSADITWQTSDADVATVDNGVVTPVAAGNVTITAKVTEDIKATCAVTVQNAASHNWYGYGTSQDLDYTYRIEYTTEHHIVAHVKRQGNKGGLVDAQMLISGVWTYINNTEGEEEGWKKGTTEATFTAGNNIHILIQSNFTGASSIIEFDYEVGSDNVMPTIVPSTLALSNTSLTMGLSDADVQLTAEIHHRDAANKTITWTSDNELVVTVVDGLVHPVGVGTTTVHAITHNSISATCEVTVVGALEPTIFWGSGEDAGISILYSITRNADHTLSYAVEALHNKVGFVLQVNDGDWHDATLNEGIYTWSSTATYTDGDAFNGFFYMPFAGGAGRVDFHYVVGSESEKGNMPIRLDENADNSFMITSSDGLIRDVKVTRTFPLTTEWYTLCLPFDLSDEQLTEAFGAGYTLATLDNSEDHGSLISLNFDFVNSFEAGKAYLLRPGLAVTTNPVFNGVVVKNVDPEDVAATSTYMNFQGTFNTIVLNNENQRFVGPENYLYSPAEGGTNMKAFRCFFTIPAQSPLNGAPVKPARIVFGKQTTTGIENVQGDNVQCTKVIENGQLFIIQDGRVYNAQGMLVK